MCLYFYTCVFLQMCRFLYGVCVCVCVCVHVCKFLCVSASPPHTRTHIHRICISSDALRPFTVKRSPPISHFPLT